MEGRRRRSKRKSQDKDDNTKRRRRKIYFLCRNYKTESYEERMGNFFYCVLRMKTHTVKLRRIWLMQFLSHTQQVVRKKEKFTHGLMMMRTIPTSDNKSQTDNTMCFIYVIYSCNNLPKKKSLSPGWQMLVWVVTFNAQCSMMMMLEVTALMVVDGNK